MVLLSILSIPFIAAIILLFVKPNEKANYIAIASTGITLALALNIAFNGAANFDVSWIPSINARFVLTADGLSKILLLLTAISFSAIFIATSKNEIKNRNQFLSLMLFTQTGLLGVFLAGDGIDFEPEQPEFRREGDKSHLKLDSSGVPIEEYKLVHNEAKDADF